MEICINEGLEKLKNLMKNKKLIIFVGSGISVPSGLPTWDELLDNFIELCEKLQGTLSKEDQFVKLLDDAKSRKENYPTQVASVLKNKLAEIQKKEIANVYKIIQSWFIDKFSSSQPNDYHKLILKTNFPYILTSNYDNLLEKAAMDLGFFDLYANSFSFKEADKVAAALYEKKSCIIHVHGDINSIALDDFVFTSEDYVKIKNKYPGFTLSIQSLFVNYSVLFVGYGVSDPHLEDLLEELSYYFDWSMFEKLPKYYIALKKDKIDTILDVDSRIIFGVIPGEFLLGKRVKQERIPHYFCA